MKRKITFTALVVLFAAGLTVWQSAIFAQKSKVATLTGVKGAVTVTAPGQAEPRAAVNGMSVTEGESIRTSGGASAIIKFIDGSMIKVGPLSAMKLGKIAGSEQKKDTQMDVAGGKVWARVKKANKDSTFTVKSPSAIAGVRGTYFSSEVDQDATSRFDVFDGEVAVSSVANPSNQTVLKANQTTTVAQGKNPTPPATIPKERLNKEKNGFTEGEFTASAFEIRIEVEPPSITVGGKAVVTVRVLKNGEPFAKEVPLHLKLGGSAVFASNSSAELDITTGNDGVAAAEITGAAEENITVDASVKMKVKKQK